MKKEGLWSLGMASGTGLRCAWRNAGEGTKMTVGSWNWSIEIRHEGVLLYILINGGTVSFLSSEFSNALEYLKLLNSFVDSVGIVTPPFSSSSVLKSALGKHPAGWLCRLHIA